MNLLLFKDNNEIRIKVAANMLFETAAATTY